MKRKILTLVLPLAFSSLPAQAQLVLPGVGYVQYGDAQSYSLPALAYAADPTKTGPGNPYYVVSTPGAIKDLIVVATGASGGPVNTNSAGMDNAYSTPTGSGPTYFSTDTDADPNQVGGNFTGDNDNTWDATAGSLKSFLQKAGGGFEDMIFFFNNNQTNSGGQATQSLAAWALIQVWDYTAGQNKPTLLGTYELANKVSSTSDGEMYRPITEGGGGQFNGNVANFTSDNINGGPNDTNLRNPNAGTNQQTDYVLSGGALCLTSNGILVGCGATPPGDTIVQQFDHNLGANQAAYAIVFPELNTLLTGLFNSNQDLSKITMSVDLRMGCAPGSSNSGAGYDVCTGTGWGYGREINNGYEQVFIGKATTVVNVPEPATLALLGMGLIGLGLARRRRA